MTEPIWLTEARRYLGLCEIPGSAHAAEILAMWDKIKRGGINDDETPWCAAFVGSCLENVNIKSTRFESAKSYMNWGLPLDAPLLGCIVVFGRSGGGHVAFNVGLTKAADPVCLGGNQGNKVSIATFPRSRVLGYRWPVGFDIGEPPPIIDGSAESKSEA